MFLRLIAGLQVSIYFKKTLLYCVCSGCLFFSLKIPKLLDHFLCFFTGLHGLTGFKSAFYCACLWVSVNFLRLLTG